jgi:hypothetical protein
MTKLEINVDAQPGSTDGAADSSPSRPRPTPQRLGRWGSGRERRAFEGRVMSAIRAQSRRRHSAGERALSQDG